ncbi:MAG: cyclic nucleotide-binding domain-containing protein [Chthoniobacterales bacterium]
MFTEFFEKEKSLATVLVFIGTYLVSLAIGRVLRRRAGVPFGLLYQLFCLTLAFYAAVSVWGLHVSWRGHVGAAVLLLSIGVLVALLDRYLWDNYFEKRRQIIIPKLLRDTVAMFLFLITLLFILSAGYHAETQLKGLLAGSGVIAIILGFAAQNLLSSLLAGLSLQIQRPYKVGDWLKVGDTYGEVMEIRWGATRLRTNDAITLHIPNNEMVKQTLVNLTYPSRTHFMRLTIGAEYSTPPNRVKDALLRATIQVPGVEKNPPPQVYVSEYGESAIIYQIKFAMTTHSGYYEVRDAIYTNAWYEFRRRKITIPFPIRTLHLERKPVSHVHEMHNKARTMLRHEALFSCLSDEQLEALLKTSEANHFGRGETVIEEGAEGDSMFVLLRGTAQVSVSKNGAAIRLGVLRQGDCFGEMSLLTGEPRTATVRAEKDCEVLEISKPVMAELLRDAPECLTQLSALLAHRKMEKEGKLKEAQPAEEEAKIEREYTATFMKRLRSFFEL